MFAIERGREEVYVGCRRNNIVGVQKQIFVFSKSEIKN